MNTKKKQKPKIIKPNSDILFDEFLPFPVSNNNIHQPNTQRYEKSDPYMVMTPNAWAYYKDMKSYLDDLMKDRETINKSIRIHAEVYFYEKDKRRRDINNYSKTLFDALENSKVFDNDDQIDTTYLQRMPELVKDGMVRVILKSTQGVIKDDLVTVKEQQEEREVLARNMERMRLLTKACGAEQKNIAQSWKTRTPDKDYKVTGRFKRK